MQLSETRESKSFWKKPEGITGTIFAAGLVVGGGILLYKFLPYLITLLQNAITASLLAIGLGALLYIIMDKKFQNMIWYMYQVSMKKITSAFVTIDPIAITKVYIDELKNRRIDINTSITKLKGQLGKVENYIKENLQAAEHQMSLASAAENKNMIPERTLATREAARQQKSAERLMPLKEKLHVLYKYLDKVYKNSGYMIQDMESEIRIKEQEYEAIKASHNAMKTAISIFNGSDDKKLMFDQAMEFISDDMGKRLGEMDRFMDVSETIMNGIDVQNGMYEEKGLKMLEEWSEKDFDFLLTPVGSTKRTEEPIKVSVDNDKNEGDKYSKLFN